MAEYEIKDVVCDYGLYEDGELKLILNSARNAHIIKRILEIDGSVPNAATAADVVEVVRCKDCKYYDNDFDGVIVREGFKRCDHPQQEWDVECCDQWVETLPDDFCSYGERKG